MCNLPRAVFPAVFLMVSALAAQENAFGQSLVIVNNESEQALSIEGPTTGGAPISAKAWKQGATRIAPGEREIVLTLNRKGKVNWMDPTPRFVEPGKEVVFSTVVAMDGDPEAVLVLRQKLLGTGKTTRMWFSVSTNDRDQDWLQGETAHRVMLTGASAARWSVDVRGFRDTGETHVEYTISKAR